ncbi:MAG: DUF2973 domain-containing protein [Cyanobacteria bacterium J06638_22]
MLHLLYILAFTVLAFLAVMNLIRSMMTLGSESVRAGRRTQGALQSPMSRSQPPHPELIDNTGSLIDEPYLVMKSISVEDARERLDALYESSPGVVDQAQDDNT